MTWSNRSEIDDTLLATNDLQEKIERLKSCLRIAVIFGGDKSISDSVLYQTANARSWKSYEAVASDLAASLRRLGFKHVELMPEDMRLPDRLRGAGTHLAWLNSGGVQGYNSASHASSLLEMLGVPYVGHDALAATTLDNKHAFKREATCAGICTAAFSTWNMARGPFRPDLNACFRQAFGTYDGPFVVKPVSGRASLHVHVAQERKELPDVVAEVYRATGNTVLIERYLSGREYCVAVAGPIVSRGRKLERNQGPFTFAALERVLEPGEQIFTSMDLRPITADRFRAVDPNRDPEILDEMRRLACEVYLEFNLGAIVRLDLRADQAGQLHVLEANPKPDLKQSTGTVTSLICGGLAAVGLDYDDLILSLLADRLGFLFQHRPASIGHVVELLEHQSRRHGWAGDADRSADAPQSGVFAAVNDAIATVNVATLNSLLDGAKAGRSGETAAAAPACKRPNRRIA